MPRRERWSVIGAILEAVERQREASGSNARLTRIAMAANLPYDRLVTYLEDLARTGLITDARKPDLTDKGREFLRSYRQWNEMLSRFGLA